MTSGTSLLASTTQGVSALVPGQLLPFESVKLIEVLVLFAGGGSLSKPVLTEAFYLTATIDDTELARIMPQHIDLKDIPGTGHVTTLSMQF